MVIYGQINFNEKQVKNYSAKGKYPPLGLQFVPCWVSKFYRASFSGRKLSAIFGIPDRSTGRTARLSEC